MTHQTEHGGSESERAVSLNTNESVLNACSARLPATFSNQLLIKLSSVPLSCLSLGFSVCGAVPCYVAEIASGTQCFPKKLPFQRNFSS